MKKILVIEDNLEVRENLCEILELDSYEVVPAENGKIGVEKALSERPDLIICDVMMPELDGYGVLKILNKNPLVNHIPFIFLTAKAEKADMRKGMGLGAEDYITKPFDDAALLEVIQLRIKKAERIKTTFDESSNKPKSFFSDSKAIEEFEKLSLNNEIRTYKTKDVIFKEDQNARWLYFVISGQVKIIQTHEYGKEFISQIFQPGDFFGHYAVLRGTPYAHGATALTETMLRLVPKSDFMSLLFNNRDFAAHFIKKLAKNVHDTEMQLIDLAYSSVRKKVANALIAFATKREITPNEIIEINISREDLAARAGTAKETLIRTLSDFKQEGLITIESKSIHIQDLQKLESLIG